MRFWLVIFIVLLLVLDIMWMLDGFLNVQYGNLLNSNSYANQSTSFAYRVFADKPLISLYYRIVISLLILISMILGIISIKRLTSYKDLLTASDLKYRSLFMEMKSGFALRKIIRDKEGNIEDIRFLEVNPAFRQHTGLGNIEMSGKSVREVFTQVSEDLLADYDKIARYGGSFTKIHEAKGLNKTLRITAYQHEENVFATLIEDITKEKEIEDELVESNQLKSILLNTINEGVYFITEDRQIIWANERIMSLIGNSEQEILGKKCFDAWYQNREKCNNCPVDTTLDSHQAARIETLTENGKFLEIYSNPVYSSQETLKGMVITVYDLTDWKAALDKLEKKQEHLNLALEAGDMSSWEWNAVDNFINLERTAFYSHVSRQKWTPDELAGLLHENEQQMFYNQYKAIMAGKLKELTVEARIKNSQGEWVWYNILGRIKETDQEGKPLKMIGIIYNINSLKTIALELEQTNQELIDLKDKLEKEVVVRLAELRDKDLLMIRQSRQAAMGEMIGNIAHQWRQPLNSIAVIIQDFMDAWDFGEFNREYLSDKINLCMSVINHMSQTIDDFRDFFSPDNMPMPFEVDNQIVKTINILKDMYSKQGIEIIPNLEHCTVTSYAREFSQVLINVLNNSKDAIQDRKIKEPVIQVDLQLEQDKVIITVQDNAGGIDPEILEKIFDPYFTTKQDANGTGLGLYMSKNIIEKHMKGEILVKNTEKGARFKIILPLDIRYKPSSH
ncbi:MAG: PAS domain-containing protein [Candidatus Cloacimonetes bacterium]|nr:PAS domain-containing protein [Candidatus Cloacimonadota bacterium]